MKTKFNGILTLLLMLLVVQVAFTQETVLDEKTVSGTVINDSGVFQGVSVIIKGTSLGTETDFDGKYYIKTKIGDILRFSYIGSITIEKTVGNSNTINVAMVDNINTLDEIVVTGVATGTSTKKLGFALTKISGVLLEEVLAVDAASTLRGKVSGINISQSQGDGSASVSFRGAKSIFGNTSPLILVDGFITNQSLGDINTTDIKSIEIIKGAAASSLYGSRAAAGVIHIITKKGKRGANNITVSLRSELGFNSLEKKFQVTQKHNWLTNPDGTLILDSNGAAQKDPDGLFDGDYNTTGLPTYNTFKRGISNGVYKDNSISISGGGESYNFYLAAQNQNKGGIVSITGGNKRKTFRANFDFSPTDKVSIGFRSSYSTNENSEVSRNGRGSIWGSALTFAPIVDILEKNANGDYLFVPTGLKVQNVNLESPYHYYNTVKRSDKNRRHVIALTFDYKFSDKLTLTLATSFNNYQRDYFRYIPIGDRTVYVSKGLNGLIEVNGNQSIFNTGSALLNYKTNITEDLKASFTAKILLEHAKSSSFRMIGSNLTSKGVYNISITERKTRSMSSLQFEKNAKNFFITADLDYKDKLIFSGLIRRDGSSLFGSNQRWQTYFRGSLAYRLTQDVDIKNVQELKLRASYGTAGRRPGFNAQYETANIFGRNIRFTQSGNPNLKPSENRELEVGIDVSFFDKFKFATSYSFSNIKNDFLIRTLPSAFSLYNSQTQNIGFLEASTFEMSLAANIIDNDVFSWSANVVFDTSTSTITDLSGVFPFTAALFRVEEGVEIGTMYGNKVFKSLSDIKSDANGTPTNIHNMPVGLNIRDLSKNNLGYIVVTADIGTPKEKAFMLMDNLGNKATTAIGNSIPDFKLGFSNSFKFKNGFGIYVLMDYKHNGDTYNATNQDLLSLDRSVLQQEASEAGHHSNFLGGGVISNANDYSSAFVENSSFLKLREISLSYSLKPIKNIFKDVKLALVGRNLLTITGYRGWNPEASFEKYSYPLYRTFSLSLSLKF